MRQNEEGKATEKFVAKTFKKYKYWAYIVPHAEGQPCDVLAHKRLENGESLIWHVDAKHVREQEISFPFSRIEPNQISSFSYAIHYANLDPNKIGFAIFFDRNKTLYWLKFIDYVDLNIKGQISVNMNKLEKFEEVLTKCEQ